MCSYSPMLCEGCQYTVIPEEGGQNEPGGIGYLGNLYTDGLKEIGFFGGAWIMGDSSRM